jgi:hypothetical protein
MPNPVTFRSGVSSYLVAFALVVLCTTNARGYGRTATVVLTDSSSVSGELLLVRGDTLVLSLEPDVPEKKLRENASRLTILPFSRISRIALAGRSHAVDGIKFGALAGMFLGGIVGANSGNGAGTGGREFRAFLGGLAGSLPGLALGGIIGGSMVDPDEWYAVDDPRLREELRTSARYHDAGPEFIQERISKGTQ